MMLMEPHRSITISDHARERMDEMGVFKREVRDAVKHPACTYPGALGHPERTVCVKGRLAVVIEPDTDVVVTVLWNQREGR